VSVQPTGLAVDHLVVGAATLAEGVRWCETTLGVTPGPGGEHALMGTHNRLLNVATPDFPFAYLEIIAINPGAPGPEELRGPDHRRWFGLDHPALQHRLAQQGPQLLHWVARSTQLEAHHRAWLAAGLEPGIAVAASRQTPAGWLQWRLVLRPDGQTLHAGALPTLIEWQSLHPVHNMPPSGITLHRLQLRAALPKVATDLLQQPGLACLNGPGPALSAHFETPLGLKRIDSYTDPTA
jgi:Glyoxalase-like domain